MSPATSDVLLYQSPDGQIQLDVQLDHDTVWLTQAQMSELFARDQGVISRHIKNIFSSGELSEESSAQKIPISPSVLSTATTENTSMQKMHKSVSGRPLTYYSLDVIIGVGYRVNSLNGTRFRQ